MTEERMIPRRSGGPIAASRLAPVTVLAHDTANDLVARAEALQETIRAAKEQFFDDVQAYVDLVLAEYNVRLGGRKDGLKITSLDETARVEVSSANYLRTNAVIVAAEALTSEILSDLTVGVSEDLRTLITEAFDRDERTGRVNIQRVLGLTRLRLQHPRWPEAVAAIRDAVEPAGSKRHIRFHKRENPDAKWEQIDVNFSSL